MINKNKFSPDVLKVFNAIAEHCSIEEMQQLGDICSLGAVRNNLKSELYPDEELPKCPNDDAHRVVKHGFSNGKQRYICKDCNHSFVEGSHSMLGHSKVDLLTWKKVIMSMLDRPLSIQQLSDLYKISQVTAFNMRLRIFYAAEQLNKNIKLSGEIVADDTGFSFSAKGQDVKEIPRKPRKRGGGNTVKNRHKNEINVIVAVEKSQDGSNKYKIVSTITGFGSPSSHRVLTALKEHIEPKQDTVLITDGAKSFGMLVKELDIGWDRLVSQRFGNKKVPLINGGHSVQLVNNFHNRLKERFSFSSSVSSKYLKGHLQVFDYIINYSYLNTEEQAMLILKTLLSNDYHLAIPDLMKRYSLPQYKDQVAEEWKKYFSRREIKLYGEIKSGAVKKELIEKYDTSYKRMRTLVKRIEDYKIEEKVLLASLTPDHSHPISERSWEIYTLYNTGKYTYVELSKKFGCCPQNIGKIVTRINKRPEGYERNKPLTKEELKRRHTKERALKKKQEMQEIYQDIYDAFNVLCSGRSNITITKAYEILGKRFNRSVYNIRNIVFRKRKKDPFAVWRKKGKKIAIDFDHPFKPPEA